MEMNNNNKHKNEIIKINYKELYNDLKAEYDEYIESTQELERALEDELERCVNENEKYKITSKKLISKLSNNLKLNTNETTKLQQQLQQANDTISKLSTKNRKLEQEKDDLERKSRIMNFKIEDLEEKLNTVEEDFIILSEEFEEMKTNNIESKRNYEEKISQLQNNLNDNNNNNSLTSHNNTNSFYDKTPKRRIKSQLNIIRAQDNNELLSENIASKARYELFENYTTPTRHHLDTSMTSEPGDSQYEEYQTPSSTPFKKLPFTEPYNHRRIVTTPISKRNLYISEDITPKAVNSRPRSLSHADNHRIDDVAHKLYRVLSSPPQSMDSFVIDSPTSTISPTSMFGNSDNSNCNYNSYDDNNIEHDNKMPILDKHIEKRYAHILHVGHMFKKTTHRRRSVTRRLVWVSKTLGRILYGSADTLCRTVRGYLSSHELINVVNGGARKIVLYASDANKTLELEASNFNIHRDFLGAFQYLLAHQNKLENQWNQLIKDDKQFNELLMEYRHSCAQLKEGENVLLRYGNKQYECILKFNEIIDRLQWSTPKDSIKGYILFEDLCDVYDDKKQSNTLEIRGLRKTIVVQFKNMDSKNLFANNIYQLLMYHKRLRSFV